MLPVVLHHVEALVRNVGEVTLRHHVQAVDDGLQMSSVPSLHLMCCYLMCSLGFHDDKGFHGRYKMRSPGRWAARGSRTSSSPP